MLGAVLFINNEDMNMDCTGVGRGDIRISSGVEHFSWEERFERISLDWIKLRGYLVELHRNMRGMDRNFT